MIYVVNLDNARILRRALRSLAFYTDYLTLATMVILPSYPAILLSPELLLSTITNRPTAAFVAILQNK